MKVYILQTGSYDERSIHGVYATLEAAMAAWRPKPTARRGTSQHTNWSYEWSRYEDGWYFDADYEHVGSITEHEFQSESPEHSA